MACRVGGLSAYEQMAIHRARKLTVSWWKADAFITSGLSRWAALVAFSMRYGVACLVFLCGSACSSGSDPSSFPASDGGVIDGASPTDGASSNPTTDLSSAPTYAGYGSVFVYLTHMVVASTSYDSSTVGAAFHEAVTQPTGATCVVTPIGECVVTACSGTASTGTTPPEDAAGTVTISGGSEVISLMTDTGSHQTQTTASLWWKGGDTVAISSTGATVKAFSGSLTIPEQVVVSAPYLPEQGAVQLTRASGLSLAWQGGAHGEAVFVIAAGTAGSSASATCRYPATHTQATIPSSVLMLLPAGAATFSASTQSRTEQTVGTWLVSYTSYFNAVYDTGRMAAGQLQLD